MTSSAPRLWAGAALAAAALAAPTATFAALQARDLDGVAATSEAWYDTVLDITWLGDANYAKGHTFGIPYVGGGDGTMPRGTADTWLAAVNASNLLGFSDWHLPTLTPVNGASFVYAYSTDGSTDFGTATPGVGWGALNQMGFMYYVNLGGDTANNPGFSHLELNYGYLQGSAPGAYFGSDMFFWFGSNSVYACGVPGCAGAQTGQGGTVWLVRDGDVTAAVPEPRTWALLVGGLVATGAWVRRRTAAVDRDVALRR